MNLFKGLKGVNNKMTANDLLSGAIEAPETENKEPGKNVMSTKQQHINLVPLDEVNGYPVRPGFYEINGATPIPGGINFTISSTNATACELLLFHRKQTEPFAILPFPEHYRIGNCYSMIVFGLDVENLEYAYRMDGPYDFKKGYIFIRNLLY